MILSILPGVPFKSSIDIARKQRSHIWYAVNLCQFRCQHLHENSTVLHSSAIVACPIARWHVWLRNLNWDWCGCFINSVKEELAFLILVYKLGMALPQWFDRKAKYDPREHRYQELTDICAVTAAVLSEADQTANELLRWNGIRAGLQVMQWMANFNANSAVWLFDYKERQTMLRNFSCLLTSLQPASLISFPFLYTCLSVSPLHSPELLCLSPSSSALSPSGSPCIPLIIMRRLSESVATRFIALHWDAYYMQETDASASHRRMELGHLSIREQKVCSET